ncbi:MAG: hypothetical protein C0620_02330 [Desulfuromonas sp.]|nr:MAG: hypothetical protein C0620_02330 [Desulfuromonas sp.]
MRHLILLMCFVLVWTHPSRAEESLEALWAQVDQLDPVETLVNPDAYIALMNRIKALTDSREVYRDGSALYLEHSGPIYLDSYGRLSDICTANLLTDQPGSSRRLVATAAHCLQTAQKQGRQPKVVFHSRDGSLVQTSLSLLALNEEKDYALLAVDDFSAVRSIEPLSLPPDVSQEYDSFWDYLLLEFYDYDLMMAGYCGDDGRGQRGQVLTYDHQCQEIGLQEFWANTNCTMYPGSSGGAVLYGYTDDDGMSHHYFIGLIHSGTVLGQFTRAFGVDKKPQVASYLSYEFMVEDLNRWFADPKALPH